MTAILLSLLQHCNAFHSFVIGIVGGLVLRCPTVPARQRRHETIPLLARRPIDSIYSFLRAESGPFDSVYSRTSLALSTRGPGPAAGSKNPPHRQRHARARAGAAGRSAVAPELSLGGAAGRRAGNARDTRAAAAARGGGGVRRRGGRGSRARGGGGRRCGR